MRIEAGFKTKRTRINIKRNVKLRENNVEAKNLNS